MKNKETKQCNTNIVCEYCKMPLNSEYIGKRCPRCNKVVTPKSCNKNCRGCGG